MRRFLWKSFLVALVLGWGGVSQAIAAQSQPRVAGDPKTSKWELVLRSIPMVENAYSSGGDPDESYWWWSVYNDGRSVLLQGAAHDEEFGELIAKKRTRRTYLEEWVYHPSGDGLVGHLEGTPHLELHARAELQKGGASGDGAAEAIGAVVYESNTEGTHTIQSDEAAVRSDVALDIPVKFTINKIVEFTIHIVFYEGWGVAEDTDADDVSEGDCTNRWEFKTSCEASLYLLADAWPIAASVDSIGVFNGYIVGLVELSELLPQDCPSAN